MFETRRYLVVDDSKTMRLRLIEVLTSLGIEESTIRTAEDGSEAVKKFLEDAADVVFMDVEMPKLDGAQACRMILEAAPTTRVIMVTALEKSDQRVKMAIMEGAFDFIQKPVRADDVRRVLELVERETARGIGRIR